ncbi:hypothetical protein POVWA2_051160 [Plasmodium ovale wallikeri]|uniref:Uncharacterized protein n=1 Tax=Plasmodium ovale wallikeri TaxID=864142 RepID=A0A1A9A1G1_PLAOA|nr:hypothetical protein POVWA2_051160 [Plasmodium ovale wallikeri]SBT49982.1 hypothetical protein POVWA1_060550 [Plasmodium ovale wallikeri]
MCSLCKSIRPFDRSSVEASLPAQTCGADVRCKKTERMALFHVQERSLCSSRSLGIHTNVVILAARIAHQMLLRTFLKMSELVNFNPFAIYFFVCFKKKMKKKKKKKAICGTVHFLRPGKTDSHRGAPLA